MGQTLSFPNEIREKNRPGLREAMFSRRTEGQGVQCLLCPRECVIGEGKRGFCRNRENQRGTLYSVVYGRPSVVDIGPIEKAPLYHFVPGHFRLCLTCASCNLRCRHCQNWHLSQTNVEALSHESCSAAEIVQRAKERQLSSVSFTYTEPTVHFEYVYDICVLAKQQGIKTSIVSNGYIRQEPLLKLLEVLDAVKIDLKGFDERFYQEICSATLKPVLDSLIRVKEKGTWLEVVNLVIPTLNDSPEMIETMSRWIREHLGPDTPLHFTRFFPNHRLTHLPPTPVSTLESAHALSKNLGLKYVYIGNVPGHIHNSTFCPSCHRRVIHRVHFDIIKMNIHQGKCTFCGFPIPGIWG